MTGPNNSGAWAPAQLSEVTRVERGRVKPQEHPELPYVGMDSVEAHTMRLLGTVSSKTMKSASVHFLPGDVLYGRLRPYLNKVITTEFEGLASAEFIPLTMPDGVVPKFIQYRLNAGDFVAYASHLDEGDRPRVDYDQIGAFALDLPPSREQHRIVEAIESYFTRLEDAVATLGRVQRNLERYRASVLKAAVEGRLVQTEAELACAEGRDYEPASVLLERILADRRRRWEEAELEKMMAKGKTPKNDRWKERYKEPATPDTAKLPTLPEGWCWTTIGAITECLDKHRVPISKKERLKRTGSVPYYGANGQVGWIDELLFDEPLVLVVEDETFTGRTKPFSYLIEGPSWVNNHAHVLRPIGGIAPQYLNYSLMFYPFIPLTTGTTARRKLTQKALMSAPYALPPIEEQQRISEAAETYLSLAENTTVTVEHQATRCSRLRQSILSWAFEGKLVDQDPTDEPATVMLDRILVERKAASPPKRAKKRGRKRRPSKA